MNMLKTAGAAILAMAFAAPAIAAEGDAPQLGKYKRTGETEDCLLAYRIKDMQILNKHQILVRMYGGDTYLQEPSSCPNLRKHYALKYRVDASQLCSSTIVTLIDTGAGTGFAGSCGFDDFQKLEKVAEAPN